MPDALRIAMWSGPRNISTAMMRSWDSRADTRVMDEPFYGAYLAATGRAHPMREAVLAAGETDWDRCAAACETADGAPIVFQKHMTSHMVDAAPRGWMAACRHAFLVRPPEEVAPSFARGWPGMTAEDLGYARQRSVFEEIAERTGRAPPVVEARAVLADPEGMLRALCAALGVGFDPAMLSWAPGRRETDGVWAAHWYRAVEASTGFSPPRPPEGPPDALAPVIAACRADHEAVAAHALSPLS